MTQSDFMQRAVFLMPYDIGPHPPSATHPCHHVCGSPYTESDPTVLSTQTSIPGHLTLKYDHVQV